MSSFFTSWAISTIVELADCRTSCFSSSNKCEAIGKSFSSKIRYPSCPPSRKQSCSREIKTKHLHLERILTCATRFNCSTRCCLMTGSSSFDKGSNKGIIVATVSAKLRTSRHQSHIGAKFKATNPPNILRYISYHLHVY